MNQTSSAPPMRPVTVTVASDGDVARSALASRKFAKALGFDTATEMKIGTAISELATNIVRYAERGSVTLREVSEDGQRGLQFVVADRGPGIEDIEFAMQDGATERDSLGLGLPGVNRLMDEFSLDSTVGKGTVIKATKWVQAEAKRPL